VDMTTAKYAYARGTNPAGKNAYYYCHHCGIELYGEEIGYVAAGTNYANGEHSKCPSCGEENFVERDENEDEINLGPEANKAAAARMREAELAPATYSDIISDGGMDPRAAYEESRRPDADSIKEQIWNRFMENMKIQLKPDEEPVLPGNFLGSVEKHRVQFMKIDITDLTK
jgi:hypothetical protein